jgi:hypothetical protein
MPGQNFYAFAYEKLDAIAIAINIWINMKFHANPGWSQPPRERGR